jgi:hypothetical protein
MGSIIAVDARLIEPLPTRSRLKLSRLVQVARDAESAYQAAIRRGGELREELGILGSERRRILAVAEADGNEHPDVAETDAAIAVLEGELRRLEAQRDKREARRYAGAQLVARLRTALEQVQPGATLVRSHQVQLRYLNGESPLEAVNRIRAEITKLQTELRSISIAPLPSAELKQKARSYVAELSKAAVPYLVAERGEFEVRFPPGCLANGPMAPAALPLFAWLFGDVLTARLDELIEQTVKGTGLSERERPQREQLIRDRIALLEAQEEAIIDADDSDNDGFGIVRRPEADPMIVLGARHGTAQARAS